MIISRIGEKKMNVNEIRKNINDCEKAIEGFKKIDQLVKELKEAKQKVIKFDKLSREAENLTLDSLYSNQCENHMELCGVLIEEITNIFDETITTWYTHYNDVEEFLKDSFDVELWDTTLIFNYE